MARKKKQTEVPGTERPAIAALDDSIGECLEANDEFSRWKDRKEATKAALDEQMLEHEEQLAKDAKGNRIYVFSDGEIEHTAVLEHKTGVRLRKSPKQSAEATEEMIG